MINRPVDQAAITDLMAVFPVTGILGPRQSGKTTLAREIAADHVFDLENPRDAAMLDLHRAYPQYGFDRHKGYHTAEHIAALRAHGVCDMHRKSYAPVRALLVDRDS